MANLILNHASVTFWICAVIRFNAELTGTLKHICNFIQRAVCYLTQRNAIFNILHSFVKSTDSFAHLLRYGETCRIIGSPVNLITWRQLFSRFSKMPASDPQHSVCIQGTHIVLYYQIFLPPCRIMHSGILHFPSHYLISISVLSGSFTMHACPLR